MTTERYVPALAYDWLTPAYDAVVRYTTREQRFKSALLQQAGLAAGQSVLDLACGTATLTIAAKKLVPELQIVGLDGDAAILRRAVAKARAANVEITFEQGLSDQMPYADGRFDRAISSLFFHHLTTAAKARTFNEVHRVLKPGGELHVADWGRASSPLMRVAFFGIQLLDGFPNTADNVAGALPQMMREAGFNNVEETNSISTMWGTLSLYRAVKPLDSGLVSRV